MREKEEYQRKPDLQPQAVSFEAKGFLDSGVSEDIVTVRLDSMLKIREVVGLNRPNL